MTKKILLLIAIDQITKWLFADRDFFFWPFHIHGVKNYGLSFSLNFGLVGNLILILLGLIVLFFYFRKNQISRVAKLAFVFIFAGSISNLIDRLVFSYVRDFLDVGLNFTFNFSDVFIIVGLVILIFSKPTKLASISS